MAGTAFLKSGGNFIAMTGSNAVVVDPGDPGDPVGDPSQPLPIGWVATDHDIVPNFGAATTTVDSTGVVITADSSGNWGTAGTWDLNRTPTQNDIVKIPGSTTVTYNLQSDLVYSCIAIADGGVLTCSRLVDTRLKVIVIQVEDGGYLDWGTTASKITGVTAEVIFANVAIHTATDPQFFSNGIIINDGGKFTAHGKVKGSGTLSPATGVGTSIAGTATFSRCTTEPLTGATSIVIEDTPIGWDIGDEIIFPDTRQLAVGFTTAEGYVDLSESRILTGVNTGTKTLTWADALVHDHKGMYDFDDNLEACPHVLNMTRNVIFRSENSTGTRGHTLFQDTAEIDLRYCVFQAMGRTTRANIDSTIFSVDHRLTTGDFTVAHLGGNQIGRYGIHTHHVFGPASIPASGYQFVYKGLVVRDLLPLIDKQWGITIHGSHYGLIEDCIVWQFGGSGVFTEDGTESFNRINHNFCGRIFDDVNAPRVTWARADNAGTTNPGKEGVGFWFRGFNNYVTNNIANCCGSYGYTYFAQSSPTSIAFPTAQGDEDATTNVNPYNVPILEFSGNEAYGCTPAGLTIWSLGTNADGPAYFPQDESELLNFTAWNMHGNGIFLYQTNHLTIRGLTLRQDYMAARLATPTVGVAPGDYFTTDFLLIDSDIQGHWIGWGPGNTVTANNAQVIEDSYIRCYYGILQGQFQTSGGDSGRLTRTTLIEARNCVVDDGYTPGVDDNPSQLILMSEQSTINGYTVNILTERIFRVYDWQGSAGDDFRVYSLDQAADVVLAPSVFQEFIAPGNGTVTGGISSTTFAATSQPYGGSSLFDDFFNTTTALFTSGANAGIYRRIQDYDGTTHLFTTTAWPHPISIGDAYVLYYSRVTGAYDLDGIPVSGQTNATNLALYGRCFQGVISPTAATRTGIAGFCEDI